MINKIDNIGGIVKQLSQKLLANDNVLPHVIKNIKQGFMHVDPMIRDIAQETLDGLGKLLLQKDMSQTQTQQTVEAYDQLMIANLEMVNAKQAIANYQAATPGFNSELLALLQSRQAETGN